MKKLFQTTSIITAILILSLQNSYSVDYTNNDISTTISDTTGYNNITLTNSRTLTTSEENYMYFGNNTTGDVNFTNTGSITVSTSGAQSTLYIPNLGVASGTIPTVTITNSGTLATTTSGIPIYLLNTTDDNGTAMDFTDDIEYSYNFVLNNSGTISSESAYYEPLYLINRGSSGSVTITNSGTISGSKRGMYIIGTSSTTTEITNSGTISAGSSSDDALYITGGGSLIVNLQDGSNITGKLNSSGSNNVLNISGNVTFSTSQLSGTWTTAISGNSTITGDTSISSGSSISPGNSIGTVNITGDLTLASGSTSNIEYSQTDMDKIIATGNISVAGTLNLKKYGSFNGYSVVQKDIISTTGGTLSGTFDTVTNDSSDFTHKVEYGSTAVTATVARKLDSNVLDGNLLLQNSLSRSITKNFANQLQIAQKSDKKTNVWFSTENTDDKRKTIRQSSEFTTRGNIISAGLTHKHEDINLIAGVFNARSDINLRNFTGKNEVTTNGLSFGIGKQYGKFHNFVQAGLNFYDSDNSRSVQVNGTWKNAQSNASGSAKYLNLGTSYDIALKSNAEINLSAIAGIQQTKSSSWNETGLSLGNASVSSSSANTAHYELTSAYKNNLPQLKYIPHGSFYKLEANLYYSDLFRAKDASVNDGISNYKISQVYQPGVMLGGRAYLFFPITKSLNTLAIIERRQNGKFSNNNYNLSMQYSF